MSTSSSNMNTNSTLVIAYLITFCIVILSSIAYLIHKKNQSKNVVVKGEEEEEEKEPEQRTIASIAATPNPNPTSSRMRRNRQPQEDSSTSTALDGEVLEEEEEEEEEGEGEGEENDDPGSSVPSMTKKQLIKAQKKREKQEQKEAREAMLAERKQREDEAIELAKQEREKREAAFQEKEEMKKKLEQEREEAAQKELNAWKDLIEVEESGTNEDEVANANSQNRLEDFIQYIIMHKVMTLESLAAEFGIHTTEVVNRLQELEKSQRIQGLLTDRGKYIYISKEEMNAVSRFISEKGKVSVSDLVTECNKIIKLKKDEEEVVDGRPFDEYEKEEKI